MSTPTRDRARQTAHTHETPATPDRAPTLALATAGIMLAIAYTATLPPAIVAGLPTLAAAIAETWRVRR